MATSHIPRIVVFKTLTSKTSPTEMQRFIDSLPVQKHTARSHSLPDSVIQEIEDMTMTGEKTVPQPYLTGLTWGVYAVALVAMGWMTFAAGEWLLRYMAP